MTIRFDEEDYCRLAELLDNVPEYSYADTKECSKVLEEYCKSK